MGYIQKTVRKLRQSQTVSEKVFWELVRNRRLFGLKFYRQYPLEFKFQGKKRFFIADFYCFEKKLVIETDCKIHEDQREYDQFRTFLMNEMGIKVVRFKNEELQNIDMIVQKLTESIAFQLTPCPSLAREGPS